MERVNDADLHKELNAAIAAHCISRRQIRNSFMMTLGNDTELYFGVDANLDFNPPNDYPNPPRNNPYAGW